ncbi:PKD domain-containing protein [candidate division GN15 bacterium]|nr:PKD domain-containing protein [candidate division GN15 bacterium]
MKKSFTAILLLLVFAGSAAFGAEVLEVDRDRYIDNPSFIGYVPNEVVVVFKDEVPVDHDRDRQAAVSSMGISAMADLADRFAVSRLKPQFPGSDRAELTNNPETRSLSRHYKVRFESGELEDVIAAYAALPEVDRVEPIAIHALHATPNDPYYINPPDTYPYDQWHYWDTYGVDANLAWDSQPGDATVVVGVLDSGVKYDHGDLGGSNPPGPNDASTNGNIWVNSAEVPGNGTDDDGNGYVDDVIGWDFVDRTDWYSYSCTDLDCGTADNDPFDGNGHGTHVAGTIAALTNNGYAVAGVAGGYGDGTFTNGSNGVKIVPCRIGYTMQYLGGDVGVVIMDYVAEAMYYMAELKISGVNVAAVNCSFGSSNTGGLGSAVDYLLAQDVMVIVAAGNSNSSSADYLGQRTDCLDVGATNQAGSGASFSNYGSWVDIAAPGEGILSTVCDPADPVTDYISVFDGTSMACPHVVGVAALLESHDPSLTAQQKWDLMVNNTKAYTGTKDVGAGIVSAKLALDAAGGNENPPVANFSGTPTSGEASLTVQFTDLSSNGPTSWSWDFGDGVGTSTQQNPSYTYTAAGTYTVSLTATNAYGSDIETKVDYITVTEPGVATKAFALSDLPVAGTVSGSYVNTQVSDNSYEVITEVLSTDHPRKTTSYLEHRWDFNVSGGTSVMFYLEAYRPSNSDGDDFVFEWSTDQATWQTLVTVASATEQVYSVSMPSGTSGTLYVRVRDDNGSWDMNSLDAIYIDQMYFEYSSAAAAPVADFSGSPTSGDEPLAVQFTDLSTNSPTSWSWDFGDGVGTSTAQNPSYTYQTAGTYTVSLTATNAYGSDTETKTDYITVTQPPQNPPVADFSGSPTSGDAPLSVQFTDLSTNSPTSWSWDFGDGVGTSTAQNPSYSYQSAGTYTVSLTATNAYGSDIETKVDYITVTEPPVGGTMFVQDIVVNRGTAGRNCFATGNVLIYDSNNQPVSGATVTIAVTGPLSQSLSATTGSDGRALFESSKSKSCTNEFCFEVTSVTHSSLTYDAGANQVTQACESGWVYGSGNNYASLRPEEFGLDQNYPNPFNPSTEISFALPSATSVKLEIFNVAGQRIETLVDGVLSAGVHTVTWHADNYSSGVYLYRLTTATETETRKMVLLK